MSVFASALCECVYYCTMVCFDVLLVCVNERVCLRLYCVSVPVGSYE